MKGKYAEIPVAEIDVGERRRADFGDIAGLAEGIRRVGLLEPILVDRNGSGRYRLVFGERRLRAVTLLKWPTIRAQLVEHLSDEEFREIELEENDNRKSLTEAERTRTFASSQRLVENARKAGGILAQSAPEKTNKRGQPARPDSTRAIAEALGTDRRTVERAEQHVATAEKFPFMKGAQWRQSDVLRVRERLEEIQPEARDQTMAILGAAKVLDPELAVTLVENIGTKKPAERQELFDLSQSDDPRKVSLALTRAAEKPPMPDPRLGILDNVLHYLGAAIKPFPSDPLTPKLIEIRREIQAVRAAVKEVSYDAQREQQKARVQ
jgi:ParB-like chromosome segregation protein Spo0J